MTLKTVYSEITYTHAGFVSGPTEVSATVANISTLKVLRELW
jgi:hypothetical protein